MGSLRKGTGDPVVKPGRGGKVTGGSGGSTRKGSSAAPSTSKYPKARPGYYSGSTSKGMPSDGSSSGSYSKGMPSAGPKKSTKTPKSGPSTKRATPKSGPSTRKTTPSTVKSGKRTTPKSGKYFSKSTGGPKKKTTGPMRFSAKK